MKPSLRQEKRLWKKGYKRIAGLDESGRGPLAGPVVAAVTVLIKPICGIHERFMQIRGLKDSKKLTPTKREELYKILTSHRQIKWGTGRVSEKVIDRINVLEATKLAMEKAVKNLEKKLKKVDFLIIDGNFGINSSIPQKAIIKGDEKVFSCAAASIIAKVSRDRKMKKLHRKYPHYGLDRHKGYPTKYHRKMLKKYGPCKIHRKSFRPVKWLCERIK